MSHGFRVAFVVALSTASIATPPALADTGSGGTTAPTPGGSRPTAPPDSPTGDLAPTGRFDVLLGGTARFAGTVAGARAGDAVSIQRRDPVAGWVEEATATADADGAFAATWTAGETGSFPVRALTRPGSGQAGAAEAAPAMTLTVYRPTMASTFFNRRTACGTLRPTTLGVAHKTLPCGTKVAFFYRGRSITVAVVDRGPFRSGFAWDLTEAAADKLGLEGIGKLGSLVLDRPATTRRR